jgi:hypothetical protein
MARAGRRALNRGEATSRIGFDDAFQYEDFTKPYEERRITIAQVRPDLGEAPYRATLPPWNSWIAQRYQVAYKDLFARELNQSRLIPLDEQPRSLRD